MDLPSPKLQTLISEALVTGVEMSLNELIVSLCLKGLVLDQLEAVKEFLEGWQLQLSPPITTGDLGTARIIRSKTKQTYTTDIFFAEVRNGETSGLEFKSSLLYDYNKAEVLLDASPKELRSDAVLSSSLKAIAAFLNCGGGLLFIGLNNEASVIGLKNDCAVLGCAAFDADKWQLELRNHITGKFKDGSLLNDYVDVTFVEFNGDYFARILVRGRRLLTFLKLDVLRLYRRQGNRTVEVQIEEIEEFIETRKQQGWI